MKRTTMNNCGRRQFLKDSGLAVGLAAGLPASSLLPQRTPAGAFEFTFIGPPSAYTIRTSTDLAAWDELGTLTNALGATLFTDAEATNSSQKFYRARVAP